MATTPQAKEPVSPMTAKQLGAIKNIRSILQRNFQQSLFTVAYFSERTKRTHLETFDGTTGPVQSEHMARTTLQNIEILNDGMIRTVFDQDNQHGNRPTPKSTKSYG